MKNLSLSFFCITLLVGCSNNNAVKQNNVAANSDYFSNSSECSKVTLRNNQRINVPMGKNPNVYLSCMKQRGWTVPAADPSDYRAVSTGGIAIPDVAGWTHKAVGAGQANTNAMVAICSFGAANDAKTYSTAKSQPGDWYLPSLGEARLMYNNLLDAGVGGFANNDFYWS